MNKMHIPQHGLPALAIMAVLLALASGNSRLLADNKPWVLQPATTPDKPTPSPDKSTSTPDKPAPTADKPAPAPEKTWSGKIVSVDQIKGIGKFNLGQNISEFPPGLLRVVDPRAAGVLLRVSPYGENYLVTNVSGMTWGGIPIEGMVLTFHAGILIDIQVALKAKKFDLYAADRAFKAKYGPNDPKTVPVETWKGNRIQMTLIFPEATITDANSLDAVTPGKIDLFDQGQWNKFEAARIATLKDIVEKRYQATAPAVQSNL